MRKYLSIKQHLYLMLVILLVPPTILLAYSISERHRNETSSIYAKSLTLARTSVDNASSLLNEAHYILDGMIARPLIRALDPSRCDPILHDLRFWYREFANLSVIDRSGQVICNSTSEVAQKLPNYSIRKWFRSATESKSFTIGEPIIGGTTNLWIVPLVQPMVDENANLMGFLSLTVNMARFKPSFVREEFPAGTEVSIIDSSGAYVARSVDTEAKNWLGQQSPIAHLLKMVLDTQGNAATSVRYQSEGGSEIVASFMGVQRSNWHVIAEIPMGAITTRARDVTIFNMAIVFLVLAAAIGAATFVIRKIERPISSIVATAVKQMRGDRTARAAELGPTEIITVARQFNLMLDARDQAERDRVGANERITYMAHHDLLTGLANRTLFLEGIDDARVRLRSRGEPFTVFMLDLDGFKDINDSFGHPAGDTLLREAGQRIKSVLCETDILARLGGDEFALLRSGGTSDPDDSSTLAIKIMDILACPFDIDGSKSSLTPA